MPSYTFLVNPTADQIIQITALYRAAGWWQGETDHPDIVARLIAGSHCFVIATVKDEIIGMGRAISDGASDAYIQDVTIRPDYRHQTIGTAIVSHLVKRLNTDGLNWIGLIAESGSHEFYRRLGFKQMPGCIPMLLLRP